MKLSVIIITKNEELMIQNCLKSVSFADEVLVVDSNSTDKTHSISEKMGARVISHSFTNYANARNIGMKKAKGDWILYIDADERVSKKLKKELLQIKNYKLQDTNSTAYKIPRENYYLGNNKWPSLEYLERLFLKSKLNTWEGNVHEHAVFDGMVGKLNGHIKHYTHRDLESMTSKTVMWADVESDLLLRANHPPMNALRFIRIMLTKFFDSYIKQGGWKVGTAGLIESIYQAYSYFIIYATLWEKQIRSKKQYIK